MPTTAITKINNKLYKAWLKRLFIYIKDNIIINSLTHTHKMIKLPFVVIITLIFIPLLVKSLFCYGPGKTRVECPGSCQNYTLVENSTTTTMTTQYACWPDKTKESCETKPFADKSRILCYCDSENFCNFASCKKPILWGVFSPILPLLRAHFWNFI